MGRESSFGSVGYEPDCTVAENATTFVDRNYDDFDAQSERLTGHDQRYIQLTPGPFRGRFVSAFLGPRVSVHVETANQSLEQSVGCNREQLNIGLVLDPDKTFTANGMHLDANGIMISRADAVLDIDSPAGGTVAAICVDRTAIEECGGDEDIGNFLLSRPGSVDIILAPTLAEQLRQSLTAVLRACNDGSAVEHSSLEDAFIAAICAQITLHRATGSDWSKATLPPLGTRMLAAKSLLRHNRDTSPDYPELSRRLGCTPRSIQSAFAAQGMPNPSQYLRAVKLNRVRRDLLQPGIEAQSIGDIAARHGFWNWSRFSQHYQRQFGELPSETRARLQLASRNERFQS